ncbi:EamA family transporter [Pseudanabaena sp. FACHB-2040]|uniref:EamA family transporter n=1 Tax=Pseudanabaena sp. FACHB-2040 TaxID=2692859 RepID=UPI001685B90F|nr:EamA family transporter [Pseudanabaena sp. FACHB-2040]MBD2256228.1 EamA family transporter [Pseudanabaena sp. FACHB-2040]
MGQRDNLPNQNSPQGTQAAEIILQNLTQDLQTLHQTLSAQLSQDIEQLQRRKQRLMDDIEALEGDYETLRSRYQSLQANHDSALSQQQIMQQQLWAKRLAQALATHLQARLSESLSASLSGSADFNGSPTLPHTDRLLASLDTTLHSTLQSLQQDLNSYQSSLSQQVSRMHSLEQQGEAILDALVNRLSQQLQTQLVPAPTSPRQNDYSGVELPSSGRPLPYLVQPYPGGAATVNGFSPGGVTNGHYPGPRQPLTRSTPPNTGSLPSRLGSPAAAGGTAPGPLRQLSVLQQGLLFIICSTLALSIHNVIVGVIGYGGQIFGQIPIAGIFPLNIPNSLMLLWLRMVVVLPLMALVANFLYPNVWQEIRILITGQNRRPLAQVVASGGFLFMSQVLIYKAISDIGPGVAVTLLFMYPLITVPLTWFLFGDRPTPLRLVVMLAITMGIVFTALPRIDLDLVGGGVSIWGVGAALLSSAAFALFLISMQLSYQRLHPVPVSLLQFSTIFVLTSLILILGSFFGLQPAQPSSPGGLYLGGLLLGSLTLLGYLCNNYGVKLMGAAQASIISSSGPVITAILAYVITPGEKSALEFIQWVGVILVTLGVVSLSFERLAHERQTRRRKAKAISS